MFQSGLSRKRLPRAFHGANQRLEIPDNGEWDDPVPIVTQASEAILAAARGASPDNKGDRSVCGHDEADRGISRLV